MAAKAKTKNPAKAPQTRTQQRKLPDPAETLFRSAVIQRDAIDEKSRRVSVSFSSQTDEIRFYGYKQILLHERGAVDFEMLHSVLFNHDPAVIVGRATNVRLDEKDRKGRAEIVFDDDEESERIFRKIQSGSIQGVSVGFRVNNWQLLDEGDAWTSPGGQRFEGPADIATSWSGREFSVTPIPADGSVGIGRTTGQQPTERQEYDTMDPKLRAALEKRGLPSDATEEEAWAFNQRLLEDEPTATEERKQKPPKKGGGKKREEAETQDADDGVVVNLRAEESTPQTPEAAIRRERERARDIRGVCRLFDSTRELEIQAIDEGWSIEQTRKACLDKIAKERPVMHAEQRVEFGEDERDKFRVAAENWLTCRTSRRSMLKDADQVAARDIEAVTLLDLARLCVKRAGIRLPSYSPDLILDAALGMRAFSHSTSDYPNILSNVVNKVLLAAYTESPATWRPLVRVVSAPDFKTMYRYRLGDSGALELTPELAPMPEGSVPENAESYSIATYSKKFGCSRQMLINDDMNAIDRVPSLMGNAAARLIADLFYTLLGSASGVGPTMAEDSTALFSTTHTSGANYVTGAYAIDIANLSGLKKLMRLQKGLVATGETAPTLNITPSYLLVPATLEGVALQVVTQITPALVASVNPEWIRNLTVIVEPRLDALTNGTTAWYIVASPATIDGAEIAFLQGRETPQTIRIEGTNVLGVEWGVYLDVGCKFVDHRGWARAKGA